MALNPCSDITPLLSGGVAVAVATLTSREFTQDVTLAEGLAQPPSALPDFDFEPPRAGGLYCVADFAPTGVRVFNPWSLA